MNSAKNFNFVNVSTFSSSVISYQVAYEYLKMNKQINIYIYLYIYFLGVQLCRSSETATRGSCKPAT